MYHVLVLSAVLGMGAAAMFMMLVVARHLRRQRYALKQYPSTSLLSRHEQSITICVLIIFEVAMCVILLGLILGWLGGMGYIHFTVQGLDSANHFERVIRILYGLVGYAPVAAIPSACFLVILISLCHGHGKR
jgi:hypothetical protein